MITITHCTNTTGNLYPAKEIAVLAHQKGIWFHLDGAQTLGAINVNLRDIGCDSYAGSAHKWLMGPLEAGSWTVRTERVPQVLAAGATAGWSDKSGRSAEVRSLRQREIRALWRLKRHSIFCS